VNLERGDVAEITDIERGLLKARGEIVEAAFVPGRLHQDAYGRTAVHPYTEGSQSGELYGRTAVRPYSKAELPCEIDTLQFTAVLEPYAYYWVGAGGTFITLDEANFYFVIRGELVARLSVDGNLSIKGFAVGDHAFGPAQTHPLFYDSARESIAFVLSDGRRAMELDGKGNIFLAADVEPDCELVFSGSENAIEADAASVWLNIGSIRAAEATAEGYLRLPGDVVEDCRWEELHEEF
jgi:hypothetical protein